MRGARIVRAGEGETYEPLWRFKGGSLTGDRFDFSVGDVGYLSGPPLHVHREQDDTFFVLEGVLTLQIGDEVVELEAGDFATVPPGVPHTFDNTRQDQPKVRVCNLMTPGGLDSFFAGLTKLGEARDDPDALRRLGDEHGVTAVGPTLGEKLGLT